MITVFFQGAKKQMEEVGLTVGRRAFSFLLLQKESASYFCHSGCRGRLGKAQLLSRFIYLAGQNLGAQNWTLVNGKVD